MVEASDREEERGKRKKKTEAFLTDIKGICHKEYSSCNSCWIAGSLLCTIRQAGFSLGEYIAGSLRTKKLYFLKENNSERTSLPVPKSRVCAIGEDNQEENMPTQYLGVIFSGKPFSRRACRIVGGGS